MGTATLAVVLVLSARGRIWADESPDGFAKNVAPLLKERCVECHNPRRARGSLDLTTRAAILQGGEQGPAIVPGQSARSPLVQMVQGDKPKMPRKGDPLTQQQVAVLRQWIDTGAPWPDGVALAADATAQAMAADWWSLRPLVRPAVPSLREDAWSRTPIDAFILATLEAKGLRPSRTADRRTLIRRLTFDLHGLPPTPDEIDAFVKDAGTDAYERLVERLLASPAYGERWGRHWLDVVHYGDTHGYDKDKRRDHAWPYRDYVIRSLNADRPYRQFIREQLAGDVLWPGDADAVVATGFVAAGPWDFVGHVELREGTVDKEKTRLLDRDDMVSSTFATFQSLTVGCARCHDHKFDPIPQRDYYRLQAVFAGVDRGNRPYGNPELVERRLALDRRQRELTEQRRQLQAVVKSKETSSPELARLDEELRKRRADLVALPTLAKTGPSPTNGYHSAISPTADVEKWVQVDLGRSLPIDEVRLVPARPTDFPDTPGFGFPVRFRVALGDEATFARAEVIADHAQTDHASPGDSAVVLKASGKTARFVRVTANRLWLRTRDYVFALAELQVLSGGKNVALGATVTALDSIEAGRWGRKNLVDDFSSRGRLPDPSDPKIAEQQRRQAELQQQVNDLERRRRTVADALMDAPTREELARIAANLAAVESEQKTLVQLDQVYALVTHAPRPIHVLHRGNVEARREPATAGALACVVGPDGDFKVSTDYEGARRVALADWIADTRNPLTWRSIVNRIWHYHFGRGLVDTPNDFGRNGSRPSHPELLDWLAVEFRDGGGSLKALHRLIVTSAVYRQASAHDPQHARIDADNRYLWRMNRQRLEAEAIRDAMLAVSGKLDRRMGGTAFELFRFKDDHSPVYDHSALEKIHDPTTYRRTVYRFVTRSVPSPFLECLDAADPNLNVPVRNATLTALQALALLNDPFMVRQAEFFAERLRRENGDVARQVEAAYPIALGRPATSDEVRALADFAGKHGLAAACRLLVNTNEFLFID